MLEKSEIVYLSVCLTLFMFYCILSYVYKTLQMPAQCTLVHLQMDVCIYLMKYLFYISEYKEMLIQLLICHIYV